MPVVALAAVMVLQITMLEIKQVEVLAAAAEATAADHRHIWMQQDTVAAVAQHTTQTVTEAEMVLLELLSLDTEQHKTNILWRL